MWREEVARIPSVRKQAATMLSELRQNQLVALRYPNVELRLLWQPIMMAAINGLLLERGDAVLSDILVGQAGEQEPEAWLRKALAVETKEDWVSEILSVYSSPLVLVLDAEGGISPEWQMLLRVLARCYRTEGNGRSLRGCLVFLSGVGMRDPFNGINGITPYFHWQPLTWEEMRLLAHSWTTPISSRPLHQVWAISTYVGACNGDPELLRLLCELKPDRVEEIVAMIRGAEQHHSGRCSIEKIRFTNASAEPWTVPRPLIPQWEAGLVTGWSYERGLSFAWDRLAFDEEDVRKAIWREQVAGLMPTIIEIGMMANWMNIQVNRKNWDLAMVREPMPQFIEPGKIAGKFKRLKLPQVLADVYDVLTKVRNCLAHLSPVDADDIEGTLIKYQHARSALGFSSDTPQINSSTSVSAQDPSYDNDVAVWASAMNRFKR